ncbi:hypothetical protein [Fodinicola acaciae]|uniref:hypothetical protein n=1 Tax=Fodinicola acaciae TaxID=2681555 RepID=UPI0013D43049|nr:hypothetical protein [Fodinicola acaciae]
MTAFPTPDAGEPPAVDPDLFGDPSTAAPLRAILTKPLPCGTVIHFLDNNEDVLFAEVFLGASDTGGSVGCLTVSELERASVAEVLAASEVRNGGTTAVIVVPKMFSVVDVQRLETPGPSADPPVGVSRRPIAAGAYVVWRSLITTPAVCVWYVGPLQRRVEGGRI